jgi:hypothetical protein
MNLSKPVLFSLLTTSFLLLGWGGVTYQKYEKQTNHFAQEIKKVRYKTSPITIKSLKIVRKDI